MTDRERLTRIQETADQVLGEIERYPKPITSTQGTYLMIRLREAMTEVRRLTSCLRCGKREPDGTRVYCTECWIETSDGSNADASQAE